MEAIDYSVVIRTLGNAHEKYQKLLDSIANLQPAPKEIIVVLPEGYEKPAEQLGAERFCYSPKGMVCQRMKGIAECKTKYALVCDDDVSFDPDFVRKLYEPVKQGLCAFSAGPLYSFLPQGRGIFISWLTGSASPTVFHKERYVSVMRSSGYSYNRHLQTERKYYETQSAAGTCFFADVTQLREIGFEKETWLDSNGYAAMEDQTMFYKAWLMGKKTVIVVDARYIHNDAKTSTRNNKPTTLYAHAFNRVLFWSRFLYEQQSSSVLKVWMRICFAYKCTMSRLYNLMAVALRKQSMNDYRALLKGYREGWQYLESDEYRRLPPVN